MLVVGAPHGEVRGRDAAVTVAEAHGEVPGRAADFGLKLVEVPSGEVLDPHGQVPGRAADGGLLSQQQLRLGTNQQNASWQ